MNNQRTSHRAWDNVHELDSEAQKCQSTYQQARNALQHLPIDLEYSAKLHNITDDDLNVAGDITDEQRFGQWSDTLPWFWCIGEASNSNAL